MRPNAGRRVKPRKCWSVIDVSTGAPRHDRRMRAGPPEISSVASPEANVVTPGDGCATVHGLLRPTTMP
jgi:hypothetical protein